IRRVLKPGGVAGIADGDFGTGLWEPSSPVLEQVRTLFLQAVRYHGGDPYLARHYRRLLLEAGFARSEAYGRISSETHGDPAGTRRFAATIVQQIEDSTLRRTAIENRWATEADLDVMVAEVHAWGERPDAFIAILDCAAVGWVDEAG
ncbi:MAG TPA: hypothetical protein VKX96_05155, partial [Chloroflexota bacterium]|nr:hypothetical protein [Chloroflexota bacterium]